MAVSHVVSRPVVRRSLLSVPALTGAVCLMLVTGPAAWADGDNRVGPGGDGSLKLIPEVIVNSGIEAGSSSEFPFTSQLFLPAVVDRAENLERSRVNIGEASAGLTFESHGDDAVDHSYARARGLLFDGYSPQAVRSGASDNASQNVDPWIVVMAVAAVPLTGLAALLGVKFAGRRRTARS